MCDLMREREVPAHKSLVSSTHEPARDTPRDVSLCRLSALGIGIICDGIVLVDSGEQDICKRTPGLIIPEVHEQAAITVKRDERTILVDEDGERVQRQLEHCAQGLEDIEEAGDDGLLLLYEGRPIRYI